MKHPLMPAKRLKLPLPFELLDKFKELMLEIMNEAEALQSCLSCKHFDIPNELCQLCNQRPPAEVIAFSCERYVQDEDID